MMKSAADHPRTPSTLALGLALLAALFCGCDDTGDGGDAGDTAPADAPADADADAADGADGGDPIDAAAFVPRADCDEDPDGPGCEGAASDFRLVESTPADGATDVPTAEALVFRFSAPLDGSSFDNDSVALDGPDRRRPGSFHQDEDDPSLIRFIVGGGMAPGTTYSVRLNTDLRSAAGEPLAEEVVIGFTTVGDRIPPTPRVVYSEPTNGRSSVRPDTLLRVDFNTRMDPVSFGGAITLTSEGNALLSAPAQVDGQTVIATPSEALEIGTAYTVTVAAGVRSVEGVALPEPFTYRFSTTAPLDVVSSSPFDGQRGVRIDAPLEIRMSAQLDPDSVDPQNAVRVRADTWVANRLRPTIAGTTVVRGDTLVFTPDEGRWQEYRTGYTAIVDFGVRGVNGEAPSVYEDVEFETIFLDPGYRYGLHNEARDLDTTLGTDAEDEAYMPREARGPRTQWYAAELDDDVFTLHTLAGGDGLALQGGDGSAPARLVATAADPDQRWTFDRYNPRDALDVQRPGESPGNYYLSTLASGDDQALTGLWDEAAAVRVCRMARRQAIIYQLYWIERLGAR